MQFLDLLFTHDRYIENNGEGATVRPWVWIAALFFAPMIGSLAAHRYQFLSVRLFLSRSVY